MTMLERLTALCPNGNADLLQVLLDEAQADFLAICGRTDVPEAAQSVVVRMAQIRYTRMGAEGLSAQSYSGASESFLGDYPEDLKRAMYRFRKLVAI